MSLKVNIQTAIHIAYLDFKELNKIGYMQYRISLYYIPKKTYQKIYFIATHIDKGELLKIKKQQPNNEPYNEGYYSYSRKFQVNYLNKPIQDNTFYYFKVYVDWTLLDKVDFFIEVDLLYGPSYKSKYTKINSFEGFIRKPTNIFTFLPICFDHYGSLSMGASYHAALMEFKFEKIEDQSSLLERQYQNFNCYLQKATVGYRKKEILAFHSSYRRELQRQLYSIQERFNEYSKLNRNFQKKFMFTKLNQNKRIISFAEKTHELNQKEINQQLKAKLSQLVLEDIMNIKVLIYKNWNDFNQLIKMNYKNVIYFLKAKYDKHLKQRLSVNVLNNYIVNHDWTFNKYGNNSKSHLEQVEFMRKENQEEDWRSHFPIENLHFFEDQSKTIKIFEDAYEISNLLETKNVPQDHQHIVVLVHGYEAHRNDMIEMKMCLEARHRIKALISSSNIGKTDQCIDNMGRRLAFEVAKYVEIIKSPYKVSFIGHSMGGIIVRSAVQYLNSFGQDLLSHLHAYISICTPHLGYLYSSSTLVQAGLWIMNKIQQSVSMMQLVMKDNQNLKQTYLYKLAAKHQLNYFSKIAFLASSQDSYVQYESSRVEKNALVLAEKSSSNKIVKEAICDMVDNLLCEIEIQRISRIDVIFNINNKTFDSFIGRTGHVKFLCDPQFLKHFSIALDHVFV